jgi:hypothetical protein
MIGNYNSVLSRNSHKNIVSYMRVGGGGERLQVLLFETLNLLKFQMLLMYMILCFWSCGLRHMHKKSTAIAVHCGELLEKLVSHESLRSYTHFVGR